jgi:methyltransferase (TIGR00027 family)
MNALSFLIFVLLQIAFLPLALVGILIVAYKQMVVSKRLGVSQTAIEVLNGRWAMHVFDIRKDRATAELADSVPNTSTFGLWLALFPLWVKYKMSGRYFAYPRVPEVGAEGIVDLVVARTLYFDRIIERVASDVEQFVLLGAGFDTRSYGKLKEKGLTFFELDQAATQTLKIESLLTAGIDISHVTFVEVNFSKDSAFQKLGESGYDPSKKTLFLWEGVTLYLNEADVRKTLQDIRGNAAPGSVVVADIYGDRMIRLGTSTAGKKALEYTNEGLGFGLPFATNFEDSLRNFLEGEKLQQGELLFMGKNSPKGPFMVVVEICV